MKVMKRTMKIYSAFLLLTILLLCPLTQALSQEAVKPEVEENTLGDGLKAIQEAKGRTDSENVNTEESVQEVADDTQTENSNEAESNSEAEPQNEAQVDISKPETPDTSNKQVEGLPRGDSLRTPEKPRYDSTGMRDPFKPFIRLVDRPSGPAPIVRPPIRRYPLASFRLAGIIWIGNEPKAMIVDPEANTYFLGVGDKIGNKDGEILEVRDRGILVQEKTKLENVYGEVKTEVKKSVLAFQN